MVTTLSPNEFDFIKALKQNNVSLFFKYLFFDGCKSKKVDKSLNVYHLNFYDNLSFTSIDTVIQAIKNTLNIYKCPISICGSKQFINTSGYNLPSYSPRVYNVENTTHSLLISGYKKVIDPKTGEEKELFKVHNSWGKNWQIANNNGWVDARHFIYMHPLYRIEKEGLSQKVRNIQISYFTTIKFTIKNILS